MKKVIINEKKIETDHFEWTHLTHWKSDPVICSACVTACPSFTRHVIFVSCYESYFFCRWPCKLLLNTRSWVSSAMISWYHAKFIPKAVPAFFSTTGKCCSGNAVHLSRLFWMSHNQTGILHGVYELCRVSHVGWQCHNNGTMMTVLHLMTHHFIHVSHLGMTN